MRAPWRGTAAPLSRRCPSLPSEPWSPPLTRRPALSGLPSPEPGIVYFTEHIPTPSKKGQAGASISATPEMIEARLDAYFDGTRFFDLFADLLESEREDLVRRIFLAMVSRSEVKDLISSAKRSNS